MGNVEGGTDRSGGDPKFRSNGGEIGGFLSTLHRLFKTSLGQDAPFGIIDRGNTEQAQHLGPPSRGKPRDRFTSGTGTCVQPAVAEKIAETEIPAVVAVDRFQGERLILLFSSLLSPTGVGDRV